MKHILHIIIFLLLSLTAEAQSCPTGPLPAVGGPKDKWHTRFYLTSDSIMVVPADTIKTTCWTMGGAIAFKGGLFWGYNGTTWGSLAAGGSGTGTVTSVGAGWALLGGTITTTGTLTPDSAILLYNADTLTGRLLETQRHAATTYEPLLGYTPFDAAKVIGTWTISTTQVATIATTNTQINAAVAVKVNLADSNDVEAGHYVTPAYLRAQGYGVGTVTSVAAGTGLSGGTITTTGTISMPNTGTAGTWGSSNTFIGITTDAQGRVSAVQTYSVPASGTGTVSSIATNDGITGGTITSTGTIGLAHIAATSVLANTSGSTGAPSSALAYTAAYTAGNLPIWESYGNLNARYVNTDMFSTAMGGGTAVLTVSSARRLQNTGTTGTKTWALPNATTLQNGSFFEFDNNSTLGTMTVNDFGGTTIATINAGEYRRLTVTDISTSAGVWNNHGFIASNGGWSSAGLTVTGTVSASGAITGSNLSGTNTGDQTAGTNMGLTGGAFYPDTAAYKIATKTDLIAFTTQTVTAASYTTSVVISSSTASPMATVRYKITAQAGALLFAAPTGSWADGQHLNIAVYDNGTIRALTYNSAFSGATKPTTTVVGEWTEMLFIYNSSATNKFQFMGTKQTPN